MRWAQGRQPDHRPDTAGGKLVPGSDGQALTAPGPATIDYRPSGLGFHSGPEAVGPVTLDIAGLKSSLAHFVPFNVDELAKSSGMAMPSMLLLLGDPQPRV
jgi:hypothetical protein